MKIISTFVNNYAADPCGFVLNNPRNWLVPLAQSKLLIND